MPYHEITVPGPQGQPPMKGEVIPVNAFQESQASYLLADGTTLTMRTVVTQVVRLRGRYDPEGNPVYVVKSQNIVNATAPEDLRRKNP